MRRSHTTVLAVLATAVVPVLVMAAVPTTHVEDFTTTTYRDPAHTSVVWDTGDGEIRLPVYTPSILGSIDVGDVVHEAILYEPGIALIAAESGGLQVIDIADPTNPTLIDAISVGVRAYALESAGRYVYVACAASGLRVVDCGDPHSPQFVGS